MMWSSEQGLNPSHMQNSGDLDTKLYSKQLHYASNNCVVIRASYQPEAWSVTHTGINRNVY